MASKVKSEAQGRLAMMEDHVTSQLAKLERYLAEDQPHYRISSAKYILDFLLHLWRTGLLACATVLDMAKQLMPWLASKAPDRTGFGSWFSVAVVPLSVPIAL